LVLSGTGEDGAAIAVTASLNGTDYTCSDTVASGQWSCPITHTFNNGDSISIAVTQTDTVDNASTTNITITIDTSGGNAPNTPPDGNLYLLGTDDTGAFNDDAVTKKTTVTLQANCQTGTTDAVLYNGSTVLATSTCDTATPATFSNLIFAEGSYNLTFAEANTHGTSTPGSALALVIDTTASTPTVTSPVDNSTTTSTTTLDFSGTSTESDGAQVVITDANNSANTCTATVNGGNWNCTITYQNAMATGTAVTFDVVQTDLAGNVDNTPPQIHVTIGEGGGTVYRADVDESGSFNGLDVIWAARKNAGLSVPQAPNFITGSTYGDVDCSTSFNGLDVIWMARWQAGISVSANGWCDTNYPSP